MIGLVVVSLTWLALLATLGFGLVLADLKRLGDRISRIGEDVMTKIEEVTTLLQQVDAATNAVAERLDQLVKSIEALPSAGLTAEETESVLGSLRLERDRLTLMARDPENIAPDPANPAPADVLEEPEPTEPAVNAEPIEPAPPAAAEPPSGPNGDDGNPF